MSNVPQAINKMLDEFVQVVNGMLGNRVKQIILYGSYARGDYNKSSDIDIMILTDLSDEEILEYREKIWNYAYEIEFYNNFDITLSPLIKNINKFNVLMNENIFYKNVKKDGIVLFEQK